MVSRLFRASSRRESLCVRAALARETIWLLTPSSRAPASRAPTPASACRLWSTSASMASRSNRAASDTAPRVCRALAAKRSRSALVASAISCAWAAAASENSRMVSPALRAAAFRSETLSWALATTLESWAHWVSILSERSSWSARRVWATEIRAARWPVRVSSMARIWSLTPMVPVSRRAIWRARSSLASRAAWPASPAAVARSVARAARAASASPI